METRLARSTNGKTIHRSNCPQIQPPRRSIPWKWAEDKSKERIVQALLQRDLKACGSCNPLDGWNGPFHACEFRDGCDCEGRCQAYDRHLAHECCMQ